jgi:hypothetical protein
MNDTINETIYFLRQIGRMDVAEEIAEEDWAEANETVNKIKELAKSLLDNLENPILFAPKVEHPSESVGGAYGGGTIEDYC